MQRMRVNVLIIGGGIVGLSCAAECARKGYEPLLVERHGSAGQETSSRNSEVVHSGIHYTPGSLKARLCVAGNRSMEEECERLGVWHRRCGKFVVAVVPEETTELERLLVRGETNGVEGLRMVEPSEMKRMEPSLVCIAALYVPSTGIVDSHALMKAYLLEAESSGATVVFGTEYLQCAEKRDGYEVQLRDASGEDVRVSASFVVNAAGLSADAVARSFGIDIDEAGYRLHPNRGHYYRISPGKGKLVSHLVYPVPNPNLTGIGIHITIDKAGQCKLGPDTEYLDPALPQSEWYKFDDSRKEKFFEAASRYFPSLTLGDLSPDQVGVRPKLQKQGDPMKDFVIAEESKRGLPRLVNLVGIESPGLTCSHEIAKEVVRLLAAA